MTGSTFSIVFLKLYKEVASFDSADTPFHNFAPLYEKHLWPFDDLFFGNLRSVSELRRLYDEQSEFRVKMPQNVSEVSEGKRNLVMNLRTSKKTTIIAIHSIHSTYPVVK